MTIVDEPPSCHTLATAAMLFKSFVDPHAHRGEGKSLAYFSQSPHLCTSAPLCVSGPGLAPQVPPQLLQPLLSLTVAINCASSTPTLWTVSPGDLYSCQSHVGLRLPQKEVTSLSWCARCAALLCPLQQVPPPFLPLSSSRPHSSRRSFPAKRQVPSCTCSLGWLLPEGTVNSVSLSLGVSPCSSPQDPLCRLLLPSPACLFRALRLSAITLVRNCSLTPARGWGVFGILRVVLPDTDKQ